MTVTVAPMTPAELDRVAPAPDEAGLGALATERGNLPLESIDVRATITGLVARTEITQGYRNPYDLPLEATYIFPLPARAALQPLRQVTVMTGPAPASSPVSEYVCGRKS